MPLIGEPLLLDDETGVAETAAKAARASQRVSGQLPGGRWVALVQILGAACNANYRDLNT